MIPVYRNARQHENDSYLEDKVDKLNFLIDHLKQQIEGLEDYNHRLCRDMNELEQERDELTDEVIKLKRELGAQEESKDENVLVHQIRVLLND